MSKIYQALEKAERERGRELQKEVPPAEPEASEATPHEIFPEVKMPEGTLINPRLVTFFQQGSLAAEQFRKLRTYLLRLKILESHRVIMVTSAVNGEGKTFVAANLAAGISKDLHAHAILVDCDLRNPSLSEFFGIPKGKGLSDYLAGNGAPPELILKTEIDKLSVIPAGSSQENPTELIGSKKMEGLIQELKAKQSNRYLILDATPILATTEPEVLVRMVDGIIFVVRAGVTPRETVQQAIKALDKEKIIGVVLNDLTFRSSKLYSRYFGSGGYYYKYGYRKSEKEAEEKANKRWSWLRPWRKE
jgi:protein-tyrosine kinase